MPDLELDCRGMRCPLPVLELSKHISEIPVGGMLAVVADDSGARPDIEAWCRMRGQEYAGEGSADDGTPVYLVRRVS